MQQQHTLSDHSEVAGDDSLTWWSCLPDWTPAVTKNHIYINLIQSNVWRRVFCHLLQHATNQEKTCCNQQKLIFRNVCSQLDESESTDPQPKIHSFIPLACAECDDSFPFSGVSSIPLCYIPFPSTLFHQPVFHPPSLHLAIYFLVYLSASLFPNSYIILFREFHFLPFSVHAQTNTIYLTLLSLL